MSKMFDSQVAHYKEKFHKTLDSVPAKVIDSQARAEGLTQDALKEGLLANSEQFRSFCYSIAKTLMPGRVSCTTYAAVVALVAKKVGVEYKAYSGFCLQKSNPKFDAEKAKFEELKGSDPHPAFATHVFIVINDMFYEYYNGDTANIEHFDYVEI
jgi:hypothetical protein